MLFSQKLLRRILGLLWLIDGLLQLQPQMFTTNMINSVLLPNLQSQPAPISASLHEIIALMTQHITLVNLLVGIVQTEIGLFLLAGVWVRGTVITSIIWALIVWYGGEGMSMLLTGQASILTGAPGAVLLYPLLGLLVYPRTPRSKETPAKASTDSLLSQEQFRWVLSGFWLFAALLQLQPYWWQPGQISQTISNSVGLGGYNKILVDPVLQQLSIITASREMVLNIGLIVVFLGLSLTLAVVKPRHLRPWLALSIVISLMIWWGIQGFGMVFTGMATDFNSGLLLVFMALACWPKGSRRQVTRGQAVPEISQSEGTTQLA